jgi:hypothetical protein
MLNLEVPPLPHLSESPDWRGFCKKCLQNLERQGVRGQNLDYKELAVRTVIISCTAYALTMICFSKIERKVRCHT